jgi:hypothetical protein
MIIDEHFDYTKLKGYWLSDNKNVIRKLRYLNKGLYTK